MTGKVVPEKTPSRQTGFRKLTLLAPIVAWAVFRALDKGDFTPYSCALAGVNCPNPTISGYVAPEFAQVQNLLHDTLANGDDVGAGVAVYVNGELKVDLYGGYSDREREIPYTNETLQMVFSCTKAMTGIVIARLVDKGLLSYSEKVATYWPEFAQGNKQDVTLKDLMEHSGGVAWLDEPLTLEHFRDVDKFSVLLAAQPHNYNGTKTRSYHAQTRGWYLNEIVRRVDPRHRTIGQIVQEEIADPYGVEWYYNPGPELDSRISKPYSTPIHQLIRRILTPAWLYTLAEPAAPVFKAFQDRNGPTAKALEKTAPNRRNILHLQKPDLRRFESPSFSGHTNARSIAKIAAIMANRGQPFEKVEPRLLSEKTYNLATTIDMTDIDDVLKISTPLTVGGWAAIEHYNTTFNGWTGAGGSIFYWNNEYKIGFAYAMNGFRYTLGGDRRSQKILESVVKEVRSQADKQ